MDDLLARWQAPFGREGIDTTPENPLSRALNKLHTTGKPLSKLALSFVRTAEAPLDVRWFGSFSFEKRLSFFPGFATRFDGVHISANGRRSTNTAFVTDHITLEPDLKSWHVTAPSSSDHVRGPKTSPLGEGRYLWFGLSLSSIEELAPVYQTTEVHAKSPPADSKRRLGVMRESRDGVDFPLLSFPSRILLNSPSFLHTAIIVGPAGFPTYLDTMHHIPANSPFLVTNVDIQTPGISANTHRFNLGPIDIQISLAIIPGQMQTGALFIG